MEVKSESSILQVTEGAMGQIRSVIEQQDAQNLFLRLYVQGGCGGIQYGMAIDSKVQDSDTEFIVDDLKVVIDKLSLPYVEGVIVDFDTSSEKPGFRITNPNPDILSSTESCGSGECGSGGCGSGGCC